MSRLVPEDRCHLNGAGMAGPAEGRLGVLDDGFR
jgi:hypothetical protein